MFETEQKKVEDQVKAYLKENSLPEINIQWTWIPFSGNWGIATSFFQLAAQDAKAKGVKMNVAAHAQEIAQGIADVIQLPEGFERAEAVRGYLNLYFSSKVYVLGHPLYFLYQCLNSNLFLILFLKLLSILFLYIGHLF